MPPKTSLPSSLKDLNSALKDKSKEFVKLKLEISTGKVKNSRSGFLLRKEIARLQTKIKELELKTQNHE